MQSICVIGVTGSGKSTLALTLAKRLDLRLIELDALHWEPNWTEAPKEVFAERVREAVSAERWVTAGNYSRMNHLTIDQADTVVWIDLPFHVTFWKLIVRTARRVWTREELWNGNRERLWTQLFTRDSIFLWCITSYPRRQRTFPEMLRRCAVRGQTIVHLRSHREVDAWVRSLPTAAAHLI